jgi:mannose-6-phosphate isomerase-like protein (cupin superfamily)
VMSEQRAGLSGGAKLKNIVDVPWVVFNRHSASALSKVLVGPADGSSNIGYNISSYAPGHYVEPHSHKVREQVYHILEGDGILVIDGVRHRVGPHDVAFLPPGVEHALYNEGVTNLVFIVVSGPAEEPK